MWLLPAPGLNIAGSIHEIPRKATFVERPFNGRFRIKVTANVKAASDGRLPELTVQVGHRASGDYIPKVVMGQRMFSSKGKNESIEFTGNIEDFPLGKQEAHYGGSGSHDVTHLSVWVTNTAKAMSEYDPFISVEDVEKLDEPKFEVVSVEFEAPLFDGYPSERAAHLIVTPGAAEEEVESARQTLNDFISRAYRRIQNWMTLLQRFRSIAGSYRTTGQPFGNAWRQF